MKTLQNRWLIIILFVWSSPLLVRGQSPSGHAGTVAKRIPVQSNRTLTGDSLKTGQAQRLVRRNAVPERTTNSPFIHPTQMPKRTQATVPVLLFFSAALGALVLMSLFTFAQFLLNRDASYGWYAAYLTATSIWLWQSTGIWFNGAILPSNTTVYVACMLLLIYGMMVPYIQFVSYLLEMPQQPRLTRWTRNFLRFLTLSVLILLTELFFWHSIYVYLLVKFLNYSGMLFVTAAMLRRTHPLKRYALAGSLFLVGGAVTAGVINYVGSGMTDQLPQMPLFYLVVSLLLEVLCFSLALGQRFYLNKEEKLKAQQQLIQQLEENQQLQQTHTVELERQLAQRETEVLTKAHEVEEQRVSQLRSDFDRRAAEAEMAGLRSQMNPHFIFNCLNSIKLYALENDSDRASEYLTKFSKLIRLVLENSRSERVTLQSELETLRLYMDMEAMRFKHKLSFRIDVDSGIDGQFMEIPPLLIQPYVENAIWHGLMHKPEGGMVWVNVTQPDGSLLRVTITDDGIGRARAAELKSKSGSHRKSFGLKMTAERIALVNQLYHTNTQVTIDDLVDADGQPAGTEVVIQIPI